MIRNLRILVIFWSLTLLFLLAPGNVRAESWLRAFLWFRSTESSADLAFIKGKYDKAMRSYEQVYNRLDEQDERKNVLALKIARFYMLLQQNERAVDYFDRVFYAADTLMGVGDVCYYIDALRGRDENQRAEVIARHFAFMQPFSRNQRYLNTLFRWLTSSIITGGEMRNMRYGCSKGVARRRNTGWANGTVNLFMPLVTE